MITKTKTVMTPKLLCASIGTSLFEAHEIMQEKRIRHLPVISNDDVVVGVISQRDLQYVPDSKNLTVDMMMKTDIEYIDSNVPLRQAVLKMLEKKISSLLVSEADDTIVGIITTDDLLWHLARILAYEKEDKGHFVTAMQLQTVGEIANQAATVGI